MRSVVSFLKVKISRLNWQCVWCVGRVFWNCYNGVAHQTCSFR